MGVRILPCNVKVPMSTHVGLTAYRYIRDTCVVVVVVVLGLGARLLASYLLLAAL